MGNLREARNIAIIKTESSFFIQPEEKKFIPFNRD